MEMFRRKLFQILSAREMSKWHSGATTVAWSQTNEVEQVTGKKLKTSTFR